MTKQASAYTCLTAMIYAKNKAPIACKIDLLWSAGDPAVITIGVRTADDYHVWEVGRDLFIAAGTEAFRGTWVGGGDFAVGYKDPRCMMMFGSSRKEQRALVTVPLTGVDGFVGHTCRLLAPGDEEDAVNAMLVDEAIEWILDNA